MKNETRLALLIVLICLFSTISYAEKNPIIEKRKAFLQNMYSTLCREQPLSRYCLYTTASSISDVFYYDPYLIEDDFAIHSPALVKPFSSNTYCVIVSSPTGQMWNCKDTKWETKGVQEGWGGTWHFDNPYITNGRLQIGGTAKYLVNLKNKDIKIKGSGCGGINFGEQKIFSGIVTGNEPCYSGSGIECSICADFLVEVIKDVTDRNKFVVLVNGEAKQELTIQGEEAYISFSGGLQRPMYLSYIKSKSYFSCETDNNEVWVSDSFGEGSTFDIHDLTYEPTKFCPQDYPAVVRDYRERGVKADLRGTITERVTRGESFTVPAFQSYEIRYATTYKDGMGSRCDINQVYDTATKKCVGKIFEQDYIIKDCNTNPEICPSPNKCELQNNAYVCVTTNNIIIEKNCVTNPEICDSTYFEYCDAIRKVCVRPYKIIEVIRDVEIIPIGKNQKSFTNEMIIGDKRIISNTPSFTCNPQGENWNFPQPSRDCWETDVTFDGKSYTMKDGDEVSLNDYLKLKIFIGGHYDNGKGRVDSYTNTFILTIDFDFLKTEVVRSDKLDYYVIKDSNREMCFKLTNDLGISFSSEQAGYSLKKTTDLVTMQTRTMEGKSLPTGKTDYCIPIDSARYGELFYVVNPYFKLGGEAFFDDEQITYNYKIVDKIPQNETIIYKEPPTQPPIIGTTISEIPWVFIGIIALIVFLIILFFNKK